MSIRFPIIEINFASNTFSKMYYFRKRHICGDAFSLFSLSTEAGENKSLGKKLVYFPKANQ